MVRGRVKIRAPSPGGKEVVLNVIEPGDVFGEIALLDGKERSADAVAMQETELLVLERRDFPAVPGGPSRDQRAAADHAVRALARAPARRWKTCCS